MIICTLVTDESRTKWLKESAKLNGVEIKFIKLDKWKGFSHRLREYLKFIQKYDDNEIICFIDAYDVLINNTFEDLLSKFKESSCELLIGAEINCFPDTHKPLYDKLYESHVIESNYIYPNGGTYIGYKHALEKMYKWKTKEETKLICKKYGDQAYVSEYYMNNKLESIKLDSDCKTFQNMHMVPWKDLNFIDGKMYNTIKKTYPCFIHFNGGCYRQENGENIMPIFIDFMKKGHGDLNSYQQIITDTCYPVKQI
tara:strand:- start:50 stop:814 length:765 start_codon:yes stop_codon:yes gene_type:complete